MGLHDPTPTYRYRLTVEVETPEGLRTGSSVIEVETSVSSSFSIPSPGSVHHRVRGEAVAVDLPGDRMLFALLNESDRMMFLLAPGASREAPDPFQARFDNILKLDGQIVLPRMWPLAGHLDERSAYPMMVTFGDLDDPISVTQVDPDDLAASFGEGVRLKRITVEMTDDPVTTGIVARLKWLPDTYDTMLDGNRISTIRAENRFANSLSQGAFSRGVLPPSSATPAGAP